MTATMTRPTAPRRTPSPLLCKETLQPSPPDTDHDGWTCVEQPGHLPEQPHRAADGTTW